MSLGIDRYGMYLRCLCGNVIDVPPAPLAGKPCTDPVCLAHHQSESDRERQEREERDRAIRDASERGMSATAIAAEHGVSSRTAYRVLARGRRRA